MEGKGRRIREGSIKAAKDLPAGHSQNVSSEGAALVAGHIRESDLRDSSGLLSLVRICGMQWAGAPASGAAALHHLHSLHLGELRPHADQCQPGQQVRKPQRCRHQLGHSGAVLCRLHCHAECVCAAATWVEETWRRYSSANCMASSFPLCCLQALCSYCAQHTQICCNISWRPMSRNCNWWRPHGAMCAPSRGCCGCRRWWPAWWPGWIAFIAVSSCLKLSSMPHSPSCSSSCSPSVTFARTLLSVILDRGMRSVWASPQFPCGTPSSRASWSLSPSSCSCLTSECWPWMCVQEMESDILFCFWFLSSLSLSDSTYSTSPSEIEKSFRSAAHLLAPGTVQAIRAGASQDTRLCAAAATID